MQNLLGNITTQQYKTLFFQKWAAVVNDYEGEEKETGLRFGLKYRFFGYRELPREEELRKVMWGDWSVRPMYEKAETDYFILYCENSKELYSVLREMKDGLVAPDNNVWWPVWAMAGDKGQHIVFTREKHYPSWWLDKLGLKANLKGRGDRFWKAMKRIRRISARPDVFGDFRIIDQPVYDWKGRKGWTMYTLYNEKSEKEFTLLLRPVIKGADGQSFCTVDAVKKAWGKNTRPLDMFSLGGVCDQGAIKGHMLVVTPEKELPADFVISDPKDEVMSTSTDRFIFNIHFHCHQYDMARTDTQSVLHYGLEKFMKPAADMYLNELKENLMDTDKCLQSLDNFDRDSDGEPEDPQDYVMSKLIHFCITTQKFAFNRVPYFFRMLVNMKLKGLRHLYAGNGRNSVRIPLPKDKFTRRYIAVWEDIIDETGMETDPSTHLIKAGEAMLNDHEGDITTWRQPNGFWRFNILKAIGHLWFITVYGQNFMKWIAKSPCMFVTADPEAQAKMLEIWDGADFDDNVIVGRGKVVDHFRELEKFPFPEARPKSEQPRPQDEGVQIHANFAWNWTDVMPFVKQQMTAKGIGFYCNRWMTYNYHKRLSMMDPARFGYLMAGVTAPMHILGNESDVIIDSHAKFGGVGLESYDQIVEEFQKQIPFLSGFFIWRVDGDLKSRMGAKTAGRLLGEGRIVNNLPIDGAAEEVKALCVKFEEWANETYRELPRTWGNDPVLAALDAYNPGEFAGHAARMRQEYARYFSASSRDPKVRKQQLMDSREWVNKVFSSGTLSREATIGMITGLFQNIYSEVKPDSFGRYRYACEEMIWDAAFDVTFGEVIPQVVHEKPQFAAEQKFNIFFGIKEKMESGAITREQAWKWAQLGVNHKSGVLRLVNDTVGLFMQFSTGERMMGMTSDRNAYRLCRAGEVPVRLAPVQLKSGEIAFTKMMASTEVQ